MEKKIQLIEEINPTEGYTEEEIKNTIWNSPPARKGYGRYLLNGRGIESADFAKLKKKRLLRKRSQIRNT